MPDQENTSAVSDDEVEAARIRVAELRERLEQINTANLEDAHARENELTVAKLEQEEASLQAQVDMLLAAGGQEPVAVASTEPANAPTAVNAPVGQQAPPNNLRSTDPSATQDSANRVSE